MSQQKRYGAVVWGVVEPSSCVSHFLACHCVTHVAYCSTAWRSARMLL